MRTCVAVGLQIKSGPQLFDNPEQTIRYDGVFAGGTRYEVQASHQKSR